MGAAPIVTASYSQNYEAVRSRVRRLPQMYEDMVVAIQKSDANRLVSLFHLGIIDRKLRLEKLKPRTIAVKSRRGFPEPTHPLYAAGDLMDDSYANMMEVSEEKVGQSGKRWTVRPRDAKHHEADLPLRALFIVHEYGTTITNGFGRGIFIRIPPRPAFRYAFRRLMNERKARDDSSLVRAAIARFIRRGDRAAYKKIRERL
jgi:hypothetical protein